MEILTYETWYLNVSAFDISYGSSFFLWSDIKQCGKFCKLETKQFLEGDIQDAGWQIVFMYLVQPLWDNFIVVTSIYFL